MAQGQSSDHAHTHGHEPGHSRAHEHGGQGHTHSHEDHSHSHGHGHSHAHAHGHSHGHAQLPQDFSTAFGIAIALNLAFVCAELIYGFLSHSLSLIADAGHNLSDVLALALAWAASYLSRSAPSRKYTYGLKKSSILASLANAVLLLVALGAIAWEALQRFSQPQPVEGGTVMLVAGVGILVNAIAAWLFASGRKGDINIRGAYLHMLADAGVSLGVVIAGLLIKISGWAWLDPAVSLAIVVVILLNTWGLLRESTDLILAAVPAGKDSAAIEAWLRELPGVVSVHDLHVWAISTTETALTVHLVKSEPQLDDELTRRIVEGLHSKFGIGHPTIQFECEHGEYDCKLAPADVV